MWGEVKSRSLKGSRRKEGCPAMENGYSTTLKEYEQKGHNATKQHTYLAHQFSSPQ